MKIKLFLASAVAFSLSCLSGFAASVGIEYGITFTGGVPVGSVGVMVVDTEGDGFTPGADLLGEALTVGNLFGADDLIVHTSTASDITFSGTLGFGSGFFNIDVRDAGSPALPVESGDPFAIYWFNAPVGGEVVAGQTGGYFHGATPDAAVSGAAFFIPAPPGSVNALATSPDFFGSTASSAFLANNFVVVPEPGTGSLACLASVCLMLRRRRR